MIVLHKAHFTARSDGNHAAPLYKNFFAVAYQKSFKSVQGITNIVTYTIKPGKVFGVVSN